MRVRMRRTSEAGWNDPPAGRKTADDENVSRYCIARPTPGCSALGYGPLGRSGSSRFAGRPLRRRGALRVSADRATGGSARTRLFTLKATDGRTVRLSDYRGKTLVLNVWATWCPPCREETPDLVKAYSSLAGPNVAFLGVDDTEQAPIVRAFVADKGVPYPQAIDTEKTFSNAYDIRYFPTTFVIDRDGIIRARNIDIVTPAMLHDFVAAANAGRNAAVTSPQQEKIDALLAQNVVLSGDSATIFKGAKQANDMIGQAEDLMSNGDPSKGTGTDFLRTRAEEAALRDRAIAALTPVASTPDERALLAVMRGDAARDREQWSEALTAYDAALAINPKDEDALSGVAFAASPLKQYDREVQAYTQLVALNPDDVDALIDLAEAQSAAQKYPNAVATAKKATALALVHLEKKPNDVKLTRKVAATHLVNRTHLCEGRRSRSGARRVCRAHRVDAEDAQDRSALRDVSRGSPRGDGCVESQQDYRRHAGEPRRPGLGPTFPAARRTR